MLLRLIFFMVLASQLHRFDWVRFIFGALLIYSGGEAVKKEDDNDEDVTDKKLVGSLKWMLGPAWLRQGTQHITVSANGKCQATLFLVVILCVAATDVNKIAQIRNEAIAFSSTLFAMFGLSALLSLPTTRSICSVCRSVAFASSSFSLVWN